MQEKWTQIQKLLANSLGVGQSKVWISTLKPRFGEKGLTLFAPTEFAAAHLRARLMPSLVAAVSHVLGGDCTVEVLTLPAPDPARPSVREGNARSAPAAGSEALATSGPATDLLAQVPGVQLPATQLPGAQVSPLVSGARHAPRPLPALQLCLPVSGAACPPEHSWRFSFDDFVVGPSNELAFAASKSLCSGVLNTDMLFLCSAPGLGKTHLMHAVGKALVASCNHSRPRAEYLTAEEFTNGFYMAIKSQDTAAFKARYRNADLLLLEDVHFLQGKEKTQTELLATIKAVRDRGGRVVFSSSFAPRELKLMDDQLASRLGSGLLSLIERPDEETRRRIFRKKASLHQVLLPEEVEDMLARYISKDVRQIESCLQTLILKARLLNARITPELAWEVLAQYASSSPVLDLDAIVDSVCRAFALTPERLASSSRRQECVLARNTAYFLARKHTDLSLEQIGRRFCRRHSTVLKGITNIEREISNKTPLGCRIERTLRLIEKNGNIFPA